MEAGAVHGAERRDPAPMEIGAPQESAQTSCVTPVWKTHLVPPSSPLPSGDAIRHAIFSIKLSRTGFATQGFWQ